MFFSFLLFDCKKEDLNTNLKTETQKKSEESRGKRREVKSMASNKETLKKKKKKIGVICIVATSSEFITYKRKHSRVSNTGKRKCWVKP